MKKILHNVLRVFHCLEVSVLVGSLFAIIIFTVLQIFLRNTFSYSLSWVEPLNQHLVLVITFVGAMVAGRKNEHIAFDLAQHYLQGTIKRIFASSGSILSALVCFYLAYICGELTYLDYLDPLPAFGKVPQWLFELFIPLGFAVLALRFINNAVLYIRGNNETDTATDQGHQA